MLLFGWKQAVGWGEEETGDRDRARLERTVLFRRITERKQTSISTWILSLTWRRRRSLKRARERERERVLHSRRCFSPPFLITLHLHLAPYPQIHFQSRLGCTLARFHSSPCLIYNGCLQSITACVVFRHCVHMFSTERPTHCHFPSFHPRTSAAPLSVALLCPLSIRAVARHGSNPCAPCLVVSTPGCCFPFFGFVLLLLFSSSPSPLSLLLPPTHGGVDPHRRLSHHLPNGPFDFPLHICCVHRSSLLFRNFQARPRGGFLLSSHSLANRPDPLTRTHVWKPCPLRPMSTSAFRRSSRGRTIRGTFPSASR